MLQHPRTVQLNVTVLPASLEDLGYVLKAQP